MLILRDSDFISVAIVGITFVAVALTVRMPLAETPQQFSGGSFGHGRVIPAPESGIELGMGWDSSLGRPKVARCVDFAPVQETGQQISMELSEVSDSSEITEKLSVAASASANSIVGNSGISLAAKFASSSKTTAASHSLLLEATVVNGILYAGVRRDQARARFAYPSDLREREKDRAPSDHWAKWEEYQGTVPSQVEFKMPGKPDEESTDFTTGISIDLGRIHEVCGDSYVSAIHTGAKLLASINVQSTSQEDTESVAAKLSADFAIGKASASAEDDAAAAFENVTTVVSYMQSGGGGLIPIDHDGLRNKLVSFSIEAAQAPQFFAIEVTPYEALPNFGASSDGGEIALTGFQRSIVDFRTNQADFDQAFSYITDYYWKIRSVYDQISDVIQNKENYTAGIGLSYDDKLPEYQDRILLLLELLHDYLGSVMDKLQASTPNPEVNLDIGSLEEASKNVFQDLWPRSCPNLRTTPLTKDHRCPKVRQNEDSDDNDNNYSASEVADCLKKNTPAETANIAKLAVPVSKGLIPSKPPMLQDLDPVTSRDLILQALLLEPAHRACSGNPYDVDCLTNTTVQCFREVIPWHSLEHDDAKLPGGDREGWFKNLANGSCILEVDARGSKRLQSGLCPSASSRGGLSAGRLSKNQYPIIYHYAFCKKHSADERYERICRSSDDELRREEQSQTGGCLKKDEETLFCDWLYNVNTGQISNKEKTKCIKSFGLNKILELGDCDSDDSSQSWIFVDADK